MAAVTIHNDFGAQENRVYHYFHFSPICYKVMGTDAMIFVLLMLSFKSGFSCSSFTYIKRLFSSSLLSAIRLMSFKYLRLLIFLQEILIPACASSSPAFHVMYSALKLNKQSYSIQPWWYSFLSFQVIFCFMSGSNCCFLSCIGLLRRQVRWSAIPISLRIFHSLLWSTQPKALV